MIDKRLLNVELFLLHTYALSLTFNNFCTMTTISKKYVLGKEFRQHHNFSGVRIDSKTLPGNSIS